MFIGPLSAIIAADFSIPLETVRDRNKELRQTGLLSKNGRGLSGAKMTSRDAVAVFLMNAVGPAGGRVDAVRRAMALQRCTFTCPNEVPKIAGMQFFEALNAGDAIAGLLDDIRSGRFDTWRNGEPIEIGCSLDCAADSFHSYLSFVNPPYRYITMSYGPEYAGTHAKPVARHVSFSLPWFTAMATALGELPPDLNANDPAVTGPDA